MANIGDKEIKKRFKKEASENPEKYYAVGFLKKNGFERRRCKKCGIYFWRMKEVEGELCGDANCSGGFRFFDKKIRRKYMSYGEVWKAFSEMFSGKGYNIIPRYPVVARWNPTMDFTIASIAAFQPYVVSGEVEAPAEKLVIPQFCLRFGDVDNVGITGSHMTGFVMVGQHMFVEKEKWSQETAFKDIYEWLIKGMGLDKKEITFHEDAWAGGGNFGPCMEFFSGGLEIGNQVYMMFEQREEGRKELKLKVLDMGMGLERAAWFCSDKKTIYDAVFPKVMEKLRKKCKIEIDEEIIEKFVPYASYLNIDEVEDIEKAWKEVSKKTGADMEKLRKIIEPSAALYSVAEHARSLAFALCDGALPGNVGGGYNLRTIFRRAQGFIEKYGWDIELWEVCEWHATELKKIFPELHKSMNEIKKILEVEKKKYYENKKRAESKIKKLEPGKLNPEKLVELYDSEGISPYEIKKFFPEVNVPDNFYRLVEERHEKKEQKTQTRKEKIELPDGLPNTKILYYDSYDYVEFKGKVLYVSGNKVVLDRSAFYPTSGGQLHDKGYIKKRNKKYEVVEVIKQEGKIIHVVKDSEGIKEGDDVYGKIDIERRLQLAQHHTATHIINGAARRILGEHVWQAGASKTMGKSRIDITHYEIPSDEELKKIEDEANRVVKENLPVYKRIMKKNLAEAEYGFRLYQGGAVPGREIRVVDISGYDVEACGGTHLNVTGEAENIKILGAKKVQDGIIRIEFVAGNAAKKVMMEEKAIKDRLTEILGVDNYKKIPARVEEVFSVWKKARKGKVEGKVKFESEEEYEGDVVKKCCEILRTQKENIVKTVERFLRDIFEKRGKR